MARNVQFQVHMLTDDGKRKAAAIAEAFDVCLDTLRTLCPDGREFSVAKTKLEEACFFAKKAMAQENSEPAQP